MLEAQWQKGLSFSSAGGPQTVPRPLASGPQPLWRLALDQKQRLLKFAAILEYIEDDLRMNRNVFLAYPMFCLLQDGCSHNSARAAHLRCGQGGTAPAGSVGAGVACLGGFGRGLEVVGARKTSYKP